MIEHVTHTRTLHAGEQIHWDYNFPGGVLLELSFRVKLSIHLAGERRVETAEALTGLALTFATGNPPDYGYGKLGTAFVPLPEQRSTLDIWESNLTLLRAANAPLETTVSEAKNRKTNAETQLRFLTALVVGPPGTGTLIERLGFANALFERPGKSEQETLEAAAGLEAARAALHEGEAANAAGEAAVATAGHELIQAEDALAANRVAILHAEAETPTGWTPYVNASFSRPFNALRLAVEYPATIRSPPLSFELEEVLTVYRAEDISAQSVTVAGGG